MKKLDVKIEKEVFPELNKKIGKPELEQFKASMIV